MKRGQPWQRKRKTGTFCVSVSPDENLAAGYDSRWQVSTQRNGVIQPLAGLGGVSHALHTTRPAGLFLSRGPSYKCSFQAFLSSSHGKVA
jgi:hypothetical protein